jgi:hypothetical protein
MTSNRKRRVSEGERCEGQCALRERVRVGDGGEKEEMRILGKSDGGVEVGKEGTDGGGTRLGGRGGGRSRKSTERGTGQRQKLRPSTKENQPSKQPPARYNTVTVKAVAHQAQRHSTSREKKSWPSMGSDYCTQKPSTMSMGSSSPEACGRLSGPCQCFCAVTSASTSRKIHVSNEHTARTLGADRHAVSHSSRSLLLLWKSSGFFIWGQRKATWQKAKQVISRLCEKRRDGVAANTAHLEVCATNRTTRHPPKIPTCCYQ